MQVLAKSSSTCFALSSSVNRDDSRRNVLMCVFKSYDKINMINCTQVFSGGIYRLSIQMTVLEGTDRNCRNVSCFLPHLKCMKSLAVRHVGGKTNETKKNTQLFYRSFFFQFCFFASFLLFQKLLKNILKKIQNTLKKHCRKQF